VSLEVVIVFLVREVRTRHNIPEDQDDRKCTSTSNQETETLLLGESYNSSEGSTAEANHIPTLLRGKDDKMVHRTIRISHLPLT